MTAYLYEALCTFAVIILTVFAFYALLWWLYKPEGKQ